MFKPALSLLFAFIFFMGSIVLPLGDFSLLRDIPAMYSNYSKITTAEELSAVDFIGDYLLHGKELFGNNEHDKTPLKGNNVQYQHQANPLSIVFLNSPTVISIAATAVINRPVFNPVNYCGNYCNKLLRPPLARALLS